MKIKNIFQIVMTIIICIPLFSCGNSIDESSASAPFESVTNETTLESASSQNNETTSSSVRSSTELTTEQKSSAQKSSSETETTVKTDNLAQQKKSITISAVGDCTFGGDANASPDRYSFYQVYDEKGPDYFFSNVKHIFGESDFSIANLECALTNSNDKQDKKYNYKGLPKYAEILNYAGIDAANLQNNHAFDYGQEGYKDTQQALKAHGIDYCGFGSYFIKEIKGIKFGFIGINSFRDTSENLDLIKASLKKLDLEGAAVKIVSMHGGEMRVYKHNSVQEKVAKCAIDYGADLVVGHHPHVLQGVELYKEKHIAYSLGNFVYGGNTNPYDKDTAILQATFNFDNNDSLIDSSIKLIPVSLSGQKGFNDFQPYILEGNEKQRVIKKINENSVNFKYTEN